MEAVEFNEEIAAEAAPTQEPGFSLPSLTQARYLVMGRVLREVVIPRRHGE